MRFKGRTALVTSGSRGIGRAIALGLARDGADIAVGFFRDREAAEKTAAEVQETGARAVVVKGHVGDAAKVRALVDLTSEQLGAPTIVISNAASGVLKPLAEIDERGWGWCMDVNARAFVLLAQAARDGMVAAGNGTLVAVTSLGSERVLPAYGAVGASKAALESVVRYLAVEHAQDGINVNAVSAGVVDTDALRHFPDRVGMLTRAKNATPAGRLVTPTDVAESVAFLCSAEASMIRGQIIRVDGGYSLIA